MRGSEAPSEAKSGRIRKVAIGSALVAACIALGWSLGGEERGPSPRAVSAPAVVGRAAPGELAPAPNSAGDPALRGSVAQQPLPRSLRGTQVDGGLTVDADGRFVPTADALALFDYFLAASGEESEAAIHARIVAEIHGRLSGEAARDAEALLDRYLLFRAELRELAEGAAAPGDLEQRLQWVRELRRKHFGASVAEALFGEREDVARIDLERRRVALDASLDTAERRERLAALEEQLPEEVREARRSARAPQRANAEVAALREAGASDDDVFALRERRFGRDAAERLASLDAERSAWEGRLEAYRAERDQLLASDDLAALNDEERAAALDALRDQHFEESEVVRVRALDRFGS